MALNDESIANNKDQEQVLKGIQPKHQRCYKFFLGTRLIAILVAVIAVIMFALTKWNNPAINMITHFTLFRWGILILGAFSLLCAFLAFVDKKLFLRKAPFDEWVYEIAEKRLGTSIIFYDSKYIYINYDRGGKEVDKREFVTEMSDKSLHYSHYYIKTFIDQGVIMVECKKRQPIPDMASFKPDDDKFWNIMPMGLCINTNTQKVSPVGWYLNNQNKNDELYPTIPSTSILIAGGTGCFEKNTWVLMYNTIINE